MAAGWRSAGCPPRAPVRARKGGAGRTRFGVLFADVVVAAAAARDRAADGHVRAVAGAGRLRCGRVDVLAVEADVVLLRAELVAGQRSVAAVAAREVVEA